MPFPSHPRRALLAGLLLLAGPAAAQTPPPVAPPPPPPPPPASMTQPPTAAAPAVDPQVTALFQKTIAAHKALQALTATIHVIAVQNGKTRSRTVTLAYLKPGRAKVTVAGDPSVIMQVFSDGKSITTYHAGSRTYQVQPVPAGTDTIPVVLTQSSALLPLLIAHPEALNSLLTQPGVTATVKPTPSYSNDSAYVVTATLPAPGGNKATFTFNIGSTDYLLRQVTQNAVIPAQGKPQAIMLTETVTALSTTPTLTAADFVFTAPPRTVKIAAPKASENPPMHDPRLVPGARPFPVAAKDLSGKPLSLAQYHGKVVLMDFWATWCGPCVGEMPNVIAAYKKYHAQGFDIVGVSLDQSRPALTSFIAENKMPWRQVFDGKGWSSAVPREYGVMAIPFGLLVGRDGRIAALDVRGPALDAAIQQALAK